MNAQIERRAGHELRLDGNFLTGYAVKWNTRAKLGSFEETILPGAFLDKLRARTHIPALVDHDQTKLIGKFTPGGDYHARSGAGALGLAEDAHGLTFALRLPQTTLAKDIYELAKADLLGGVSIGFIAEQERWEGKLRTLSKIDLREVSIITGGNPAYPDTSVAARSHEAATRGRSLLQRRIDLLALGSGE